MTPRPLTVRPLCWLFATKRGIVRKKYSSRTQPLSANCCWREYFKAKNIERHGHRLGSREIMTCGPTADGLT